MVTLDGPLDYVWMLLIAAGVGLIGGLVFELLQERRGEIGALELPGRQHDRRFLRVGFFGNLLVGAAAAVAAIYFFPQEVLVKVDIGGVEEIQTRWQIAKLVPLSLIVGSAGPAFLVLGQGMLLAVAAQQRLRTTQDVATTVTEQVARAATDQAFAAFAEELRKATGDLASAKTSKEVKARIEELTSAAAEAEAPGRVVEQAQEAIAAAASGGLAQPAPDAPSPAQETGEQQQPQAGR